MSTGGKPSTQVKTEPESRPQTFDHLKSMKKPVTRTLRLCLDSEIGEEYAEAQQQLRFIEVEAEHAGPENAAVQKRFKEAKARFEKAEKAATERSMTFVFRSIGRKQYENLLLGHPPTEAQKQQAADYGQDPDNLEWNSDTFPPSLIHAAMVEPDFTEDQIMEIYNDPDWSAAELGALFSTAQSAQFHASVIDLGKG